MNQILALAHAPQYGKFRRLTLLLFTLLLAAVAYSHWHQFMVQIVEWQKSFHTLLAKHISAVAQDASGYGWTLVALSFGYGVFHAIGPGHGKAVIVTYLGTHRESLVKGIGISMVAALLQSAIAIALVSVLATILQFKFADIHHYGNNITLVSYIMVMLLGLLLLGTSLHRLLRSRREAKLAEPVHHDDINHQNHHHHHHHRHEENTGCDCNHAYVHPPNQSWLQTVTVVMSMGLRPCAGAIIVLIYAHLTGVFYYGVLATVMMGIGTGLSVSAIALGTQFARNWFESIVADSTHGHPRTTYTIMAYVRIAGGITLVLIGWSLYNAATNVSLDHPLF